MGASLLACGGFEAKRLFYTPTFIKGILSYRTTILLKKARDSRLEDFRLPTEINKPFSLREKNPAEAGWVFRWTGDGINSLDVE
ncbi:hypothetical protein QVM41_32335 [Pseudomonas shirazica]|uniref:hypothetical protein n=1 Tax=Pseudomonas shirazica TaxID=1940636 RepID=UPI003525941D